MIGAVLFLSGIVVQGSGRRRGKEICCALSTNILTGIAKCKLRSYKVRQNIQFSDRKAYYSTSRTV